MKLFTIFLLFTATAQASDIPRDGQAAEMSTSRDLEAIGVVTSVAGQATGFLVGACEVLTVKHAAGWVGNTIGRRMDFRQTGRNGYHSRGTVIAEGNLDLLKEWYSVHRLGDWMLLRLDRCLGRSIQPAKLSTKPIYWSNHWAPKSPPLQSAGFPASRNWREGITRDPDCRVVMIINGQYYNDCAARPGNSGSPMFAFESQGTGRMLVVFAMHSASQNSAIVPTEQKSIAIPSFLLAPLIAPLLTN